MTSKTTAKTAARMAASTTANSAPASPKPRRSRRLVSPGGFSQLALALPPDFQSPTAVNSFIYSLAVEVVAGRVDSRSAAVLGYLSQLALQTLPYLIAELTKDQPVIFEYVSRVPRPPSEIAREANRSAASAETATASPSVSNVLR